MLYRKYKADHLFTGLELLGNDQVLITSTEGVVEAIVHESEAGDDVAVYPGWIVPGFVNAHCHLELSHMRGVIPQQTGMVDFLLGVLKERMAEPGTVLEAMRTAEDEMVRNGIVAVGDICNTADSLLVKAGSKMHYHSFVEVTGFVPVTAFQRFKQAEEVLSRFRTNANPQGNFCHSSVSPHAPYSVSPDLMQLINEATAGQTVSIHNQESQAENEFFSNREGDFLRLYKNLGIDISFFEGTGTSSLQYWLPVFTRQQQLIMVHDLALLPEDLLFIQNSVGMGNIKRPYCCVCPGANLYIQDQLPDFEMLYTSGMEMIIGTDSLASNTALNILQEIGIIHSSATSIPLEEIFKWATINGAKALGMDRQIGSFERGKTPGVVQLSDLGGMKDGNAGVQRLI